MGQGLVDEQVTRRPANRLEHMGVGQPFLVKALDKALAGSLGRHADPAAHQVILFPGHQSRSSSQLPRQLNASLKVRSSCRGVMDT
ncbi:hypothetical protein D3C73_1484100 [compost metagenome]